jgi:RNA polymerase sigma-70 factor, ECF subfamily
VPAHAEVEQRYRLMFERHWRPVRVYALRRTGDLAAADEVAAEVFLVAWRRIGEVPPDNELPWLLGVARRVLSNARRSDARRDRLLARLRSTWTDQTVDATALVVERSDLAEQVRAALGRLSSDDAEVLQLAVWEQLTHAQIAIVLDVSVNAVAIRLHRARRRLAQELSKASPPVGNRQFDSEANESEM